MLPVGDVRCIPQRSLEPLLPPSSSVFLISHNCQFYIFIVLLTFLLTSPISCTMMMIDHDVLSPAVVMTSHAPQSTNIRKQYNVPHYNDTAQ